MSLVAPRFPLVLASTSPARQELLRRAGLAFEALSPNVVETLDPHAEPAHQAAELACQKARAIARTRPDAIVLGADQVLSIDGLVFGKPANASAAREQLERLNGRSHRLITGVCLIHPTTGAESWNVVTTMHVRALTPDELGRYVQTNEWEGCAGGYRVEARGGALFEAIEGDYTNVLGLPMPSVLGRLRALGHPIF